MIKHPKTQDEPAPSRPRTRLLSESTQDCLDEARRLLGFSLFDTLHGYVYARWPYLYIGVAVGEHPLAKIFAPLVKAVSRILPQREYPPDEHRTPFSDAYHGKVVPFEAATQLVMVQEDIELRDLEQIIPYPMARDIILKNPDHIIALDCPCRMARENPCLPLDVCLIVGEPFTSFIAEHHPSRTRWITQDEAVEILREEQERGHVSHAFFKDAMLGRFYAICNCCSCCCGAMQAQRMGTPMLTSSGYVAMVDARTCKACGTCESNCQFEAISVVSEKAVVDAARCMGCGVCVAKCSEGAISLYADPDRGIPLDIHKLIEQAAAALSA